MNIKPHLDSTLALFEFSMVKLTVFDWFILNGLPLLTKEAVIQIDLRHTNQIISEEKIIVHDPYLQRICARKINLKLVAFVEFWIRLIVLVILLFIKLL